jgi:hypothetical protein
MRWDWVLGFDLFAGLVVDRVEDGLKRSKGTEVVMDVNGCLWRWR